VTEPTSTPISNTARRRRSGAGRLTPAGAALLLAVVVLLFALAVPIRTLLQQRSDLGDLQREEQTLRLDNQALRTQVTRLHDPAYLERVARECLGMAKPGEIQFVITQRSGSDPAASGNPADPNRREDSGVPAC
jgi:cell division protein FtsB